MDHPSSDLRHKICYLVSGGQCVSDWSGLVKPCRFMEAKDVLDGTHLL